MKPAENFLYDAEIVTKVSATDIKRQHKDIFEIQWAASRLNSP